ncbi:MAG: RES family NAD+ phosphorylase [Prevotellaceae bacterium]|nr:RES family NAD+ phosphorylase [Prevotellaceae bacterium]
MYRLSKAKFAQDLSGRGAELIGGRWNSKGVPLLYTANSRALCVAEIAVHTPLGIVPSDYCLITLSIPDDSIAEVLPGELPTTWKALPYMQDTQHVGNSFVKEGGALALKVPSAVVQGEHNYLLNPRHRNASDIKMVHVEPLEFDGRLFGLK